MAYPTISPSRLVPIKGEVLKAVETEGWDAAYPKIKDKLNTAAKADLAWHVGGLIYKVGLGIFALNLLLNLKPL
jgi:hypothetical protein